MLSFLHRYRRPLFMGIVAIFLVGIFVGLGGYMFSGSANAEAVARVGSTKIPYSVFLARVNQYADLLRNRGTDVNDQALKEIKQGMLREMIVDEIFAQRARDFGIDVTDQELAMDIHANPAFQSGGRFDLDAYIQALRTVYRETPQRYEADRRKQLYAAKFKRLVFHAAKIAPAELRELYAQTHKGSMKGFEKDKDSFAERLQESRALELLNYYLRQLRTQVEIQSYLEQREAGT